MREIKLRAFRTMLDVNPIYISDDYTPFYYFLNYTIPVNANPPFLRKAIFQITEEFDGKAQIYDFVGVEPFDK